MPGPDAWQAFASVVGVLIFLGGGVLALKRLGIMNSAPPAPAPAADCGSVEQGVIQRVHTLERELDALKLHIAENFVRRDDYITNQSRVIGLLETHSATLARLEERIGAIK